MYHVIAGGFAWASIAPYGFCTWSFGSFLFLGFGLACSTLFGVKVSIGEVSVV